MNSIVTHKVWTLAAIGGACTSFVTVSLPWLQFVAVVISIVAGVKALWPRKPDKTK